MPDSTDNLLKQITLGEDSTLELKRVEFKGGQVSAPHRNGMADEMPANSSNAICGCMQSRNLTVLKHRSFP